MLDFTVKTSKLKIDIDVPDKRFWQAIALDSARTIRERTEKGQRVDGGGFKPYSKAYAKTRAKGGRTATPNLTWSGRMLGSIQAKARKFGVFSRTMGARISITGTEGFKAWANEEHGRDWFELSDKQIATIFKRINAWMKRKNRLK